MLVQHSCRCTVLSWHCQHHPAASSPSTSASRSLVLASWPSAKAPGACLPLAQIPCWNNCQWQARTKLRSWPFLTGISGDPFTEKKMLWKPGHRGTCLLLYRAERSAVEVQREPGLIALIIRSCNSSCQREGGWTVPVLAAEHCPCFPRRDIGTADVIKMPWAAPCY